MGKARGPQHHARAYSRRDFPGCDTLSQLPVEAAIHDGFADVVGVDGFGAGETGRGSGDTEDLVVGTGAEAKFGEVCSVDALAPPGRDTRNATPPFR